MASPWHPPGVHNCQGAGEAPRGVFNDAGQVEVRHLNIDRKGAKGQIGVEVRHLNSGQGGAERHTALGSAAAAAAVGETDAAAT